MIRHYGAPNGGTFQALIDTSEVAVGFRAKRYITGGRGWQMWLILPCVRIGYTTMPKGGDRVPGIVLRRK